MARIGKWTTIYMDDSGPTARDISGDVLEIDGLPLTRDEIEASGYGEDHNYVVGQADSNVTLTMQFTTTASTGTHTVFSGIQGSMANTYTLTVQLGNNAAATTGDPEFEGEYYVSEYTVNPVKDGLQQSTAKLVVAAGQSTPAWGTVA